MHDLYKKEKEVIEQEISKNYTGSIQGLKDKTKENLEMQASLDELMNKFNIPKMMNKDPFDYDSQEEVITSSTRKRKHSDGSFSGSDSSFRDMNFHPEIGPSGDFPKVQSVQNRRDFKRA